MPIYSSRGHQFFDELVVHLLAVCSMALGQAASSSNIARAFSPSENIIIHGSSKVSKIQLVFFPYEAMKEVVEGRWPAQIELDHQPLSNVIPQRFEKMSGIKRFQIMSIQYAFISYFEKIRTQIEAAHSTDAQNWPPVCNFARVIRNAFAHGGEINFRNPRADPVIWRTLTYSPADNGRVILYRDFTSVEAILLMCDIDGVL